MEGGRDGWKVFRIVYMLLSFEFQAGFSVPYVQLSCFNADVMCRCQIDAAKTLSNRTQMHPTLLQCLSYVEAMPLHAFFVPRHHPLAIFLGVVTSTEEHAFVSLCLLVFAHAAGFDLGRAFVATRSR